MVMRPLRATTGLAWMGRWYRLMKKVDDVISCTSPQPKNKNGHKGQSREEGRGIGTPCGLDCTWIHHGQLVRGT